MSAARRVVISMGDPTGIGPEVAIRGLTHGRTHRMLRPILVGDLAVFQATVDQLRLSLPLASWQPPAALPRGAVAVREVSTLSPQQRRPGRPTVASGRAAHNAIVEAVQLVQRGIADALVTAPICKANVVAAGVAVGGHTELLAQLTQTTPVRMMMVGKRLRVVLVTTHVAIAQVPALLSRRLIFDTILLTHRTLHERFGLTHPRIGVAGLNPHAGERGLFGDEEQRLITPAIRAAVRRHIRVAGPFAADSLFPLTLAGRFDALVCMYHDQALAPFKLLHFADGVNVTMGLPFIRTSPDHGTAHDIAGRGRANPGSMIAALQLAAQLGRARPAGRTRRAA